jgi:N-acetyl-D-muramate 6-phosphate phosphatase
MIKAFFFDLDGTLMDTAQDITLSLNYALTAHKLPEVSLADLQPIISGGSRKVLKELCDVDAEHPHYTSIIKHIWEYYPTIMTTNTLPFAGFVDALDALDSKQTPWGVVSNKPEIMVRDLLKAFDLDKRSVVIYGADTFSKNKPDPMQLIEAAKAVNLAPEECAYVGDYENDIIAANAAGMVSIIAEFGYAPDDGSHKHWGADICIKQPSDLLIL